MPLAEVGLDVDQGEDWTAQVVITDQDGDAMRLVRPIQMNMKNLAGQLVLTLTVPDTIDPTIIPEISYSPEIGLIQIHIEKRVTAAIPAGLYNYDLFASVNDGAIYAGSQRIRVLAGTVTVNKRITVM